MELIFDLFNSDTVIWLIPIFVFIHEVEEWNILRWYKTFFVNLPESTSRSIHIHIFVLSLVVLFLSFLAYVTPNPLRSIIVIFISTFFVTNTIQHLIQTLQFKTYAPGLGTGILMSTICILVNKELIQLGQIILPFYLMCFLCIPTVIRTIKAKNEMTPEIRRIHEFFIHLEKTLITKA